MQFIRIAILDASALLLLVTTDSRQHQMEKAMVPGLSRFATDVCLVESLGVLKRRWCAKEDTASEYANRAFDLVTQVGDGNRPIRLLKTDITNTQMFVECELLAQKHKIDILDALQIVSIRCAFKTFAGESEAVLWTADRDLDKAAVSEGIKSLLFA